MDLLSQEILNCVFLIGSGPPLAIGGGAFVLFNLVEDFCIPSPQKKFTYDKDEGECFVIGG